MVLLQRMMIFFIMMLVGIVARKCKMITPDNQKQLSAIVVNIANPALLLTGAFGDGEKLGGKAVLITLSIAIGMFAVMILLANILPKLLGFKKDSRSVVNMMLVFSNIGFIGIPLVSSIYGESAIIYVTLFTIPFNVLFYTYGVHTICIGADDGKINFKKMLNVGVIACIITIVLYFADIKLPTVAADSITMLSQLTGPLAMMIIGASLVDISFKELFTNIPLLLFALIKMIVLPVVLLFVLKQFVTNEILLGVCLVMLAAPAGSMVPMLAKQYNEGSYDLATMGVSLTTALSVLTMPLVSLITGVG